MDWRTLVLIASLFLNGFLLNSLRQLDFQTRELTQSATRQKRDLTDMAARFSSSTSGPPSSLRDLISDTDLDQLIRKMARAEIDALTMDCGPRISRNSTRLRALRTRFNNFTKRYSEVVKKSSSSDLKDPKVVREIAAQLKAEVVKACK